MTTTNYDGWKAQFDKQIDARIQVTDKIQVEAAKELLKRIEKRTPIGDPSLWNYPAPPGYVPGTLRASWTMSVDGSKGKVFISISNNQPYADRVEHGWSTQAPEGMLRISCLEWSDIVNQTARKFK